MRKLALSFLVCFVIIQLSSCKKEANKSKNQKEVTTEKKQTGFSLENAENTIKWTAYKTTDKVPVKGQFKKVTIISGGKGDDLKAAINNVEFSVPVSSLFTNDTSRDYKIKKFFFGVMDKTELLSGKLVLENDSLGYTNITMNGVEKKLPFHYSLDGKKFSMSASMKISDWKAEKALNSLNTVCKDLHKGADGVSKTWDDVAIEITSIFK